ncbi:MAG: hypothetical protein J6U51_07580 [Bacteroidales bacterium]|nr:hypothetical protein [Bacteroidales bacterium]
MKNTLIKLENGTYEVTLSNGQTYPCRRWLEKKPNKEMWHVVLPKEASQICGRTYIRESYFDNSDIYEFEDKTEHRSGIGQGGWKSRLTPEELEEYESHEKRMEELKQVALSRPIREKTEMEKLREQIAKLKMKLEKIGVEV